MKGGTITLVLLIAICCPPVDHFLIRSNIDRAGSAELKSFDSEIKSSLMLSQEIISRTYISAAANIEPIMRSAAESLNLQSGSRGHIYHLGRDLAGAMACIDTSEMPDTYGSPFSETRAFVEGGWEGLSVLSGDLSHVSSMHRISFLQFMEDVVPNLTARDTVIINSMFVDGDPAGSGNFSDEIVNIYSASRSSGATVQALKVCVTKDDCSVQGTTKLASSDKLSSLVPALECSCKVTLPMTGQVPGSSGLHLQGVLSMKILLNIVSTYAQGAGRGAIYKVSVFKVYYLCNFWS